jgi:hypothetical protein
VREADVLNQALGDQHRLGRVAACMTDCLGGTGDPQRALEAGQRTLTLAETLRNAAFQAVAHLFRSRALWYG